MHRIALAANTMDDRLQFVRRTFNPSTNVAARKLSRFTPQSARLTQDPADVMTSNADCRLLSHVSHHRAAWMTRRVTSA